MRPSLVHTGELTESLSRVAILAVTRMVCWHEKLQDYNFKILHIPRKTNTPADVLSQPSGEDIQETTKEVSLIPPEVFLQIFRPDSDDSLKS